MSEPTKVLPFAPPAAPVPVPVVDRRFDGYPRFALEFARPVAAPLVIPGFGIPGGMRNGPARR